MGPGGDRASSGAENGPGSGRTPEAGEPAPLVFVFTDIQGSTRLLERLEGRYGEVLATHADLVRAAVAAHHGREVDTQGDAFFLVFTRADDAVAFAAQAQQALADHAWPDGEAVRLRMGIHAGTATATRTGFVGMDVHLGARIAAAAHGGQVLLSRAAGAALGPPGPASPPLIELGSFTLKDIRGQVELLQLDLPTTPVDLPPPRTLDEVEEPPEPGESPYPGLVQFEEADAARFFGREAVVEELAERLRARPFLAVVGASGSGKSSLVRAGLIPQLRRHTDGAGGDAPVDARIALLTPGDNPARSLDAALAAEPGRPDAIVVDQLEELFTLCHDEAAREVFVARVLEALDGGSRVVVVLRADFYDGLAAFDRLRTLVADHQAYLGPMGPAEIREAIEGPARQGGWLLAPGLVDLIVHDLGTEPGNLPLLSHALRETWLRRRGRALTLRGYLDSGGVHGAIARTADTLVETLAGAELQRTRSIFLRLTELGFETPDTRRRARLDELVRDHDDPATRRILDRLVAARLVVADDRTAEVAHEALIREWPLLRHWLDEDREQLRLQRAITAGAQEWANSGTDPSLLLRGARLDAASAWLASHPDEVNALERRFLEASRSAVDAEVEEREAARRRELEAARRVADAERDRADAQARSARRTRWAAAGLGVLVLVAAGLAVFASAQSQRAEDEAQAAREQERIARDQRGIADSRERAQAATAQLATDPELSVLLALEALRAAPSQEADRALRVALLQDPLRRRAEPGWNGWTLDLARDGTRVLGVDAAGELVVAPATSPGDGSIERRGAAPDAIAGQLTGDGRVIVASGPEVTVLEPGDGGGRTLVTDMPLAVSLATDVEGTRLAVGGQVLPDVPAANLEVWDLGAGTRLASLRSGDFTLTAVALDALGTRVAGGGWDRVVRVWDVGTTELLATLRGATSLITAIAFSPDGALVAAGGVDPAVRVWHVASGDLIAELEGHTAPLTALAFDAAGRQLLSTAADGTARIWDPLARTELASLRGSGIGLMDGAFLPGAGQVTTVSDDGTVITWDAAGGWPIATAVGHSNEVSQIAASADGRRLVTASIDGTARTWDAADGAPLAIFRGHDTEVWSADLSADGRTVVSADVDGAILTWDAETGALGQELAVLSEGLRRVDWSPDGTAVATAGDGGTWLLDASTGAPHQVRDGASQFVAFSPDGTSLVTAASETDVVVLDRDTGDERARLSGHGALVFDAAFDPSGERVVTASADGTARIWDARTGATILELRGPATAGSVNSAAFDDDADRVVTASDDGLIRVWDATTGSLLLELVGDADQVRSAVFVPGGQTIAATASRDANAKLFACDLCGTTDALVELARSRVTRELTQEERVRFLHEAPATAVVPSPGPTDPSPASGADVSPTPVPPPAASPVPAAEASPSAAPSADPHPSPSAAPSVDASGMALCGGRRSSCDLAAGRYRAELRPPLSFVVGSGWINDYVGPRWIALSASDGTAMLAMLRDPQELLIGGRVVLIAPGPDGLVAAIRRPYGLRVSDPVPVVVGGRSGISVDVVNELDRDLEVLQHDEGALVISAGEHGRWYAVDVDGTVMLLVAAVSEGDRFDERIGDLEAIVQSVAFEPPE